MLTGSIIDVFLNEARQFVQCHKLSLAGIVVELPDTDFQCLDVGQQVELSVYVEDKQATVAGVVRCRDLNQYAIDFVWDDSDLSARELERLRDVCHRLESNWVLNRAYNTESDPQVIK